MGPDTFAEELAHMTSYLIRKLSPILAVSEEVDEAIRVLAQDEAHYARQDEIIASGDDYANVFLVNHGWAVRYKLLESGARQIVNFALPGDFLCFNATLFRQSDYYIGALTELRLFVLPLVPFAKMLSLHPELALALSWANAHEEAVLAERIASLGRRTARQRMAHLFCELYRRVELLGLTNENGLRLPVTQEDLADTLGLSAVHVNRTLRQLRAEQLIKLEDHHLRILDMKGLERVAGFDSGYLHFTEQRQSRFV
ncbi:MAG: Crp/Fnr family transcriptional regulator [Azospirillaceae bacterium]